MKISLTVFTFSFTIAAYTGNKIALILTGISAGALLGFLLKEVF